MRKLLKDENDFNEFEKIVHTKPQSFIRCNTLKVDCDELFFRLQKKWNVVRPFSEHPEIILVKGKWTNKINENNKLQKNEIINNGGNNIDDINAGDNELSNNINNKKSNSGLIRNEEDVGYDYRGKEVIELGPGELGNAIEHLLGYFYVQEISSMMSVIALSPKPGDFVLDVAASPGSKTTQMAAMMQNKGTIIANDIKLDRIKILNANLERCGVMNCIVTRNDGVGLCSRLADKGFKFDKILLDAPCSGEGTLRSSPKTFLMWNFKVVKKLSREQKKLIANAIKCLKVGGEIVYSTCTHSPEENESVVDFALKNFPVSIEKVKLPLKCRAGVTEWNGGRFDDSVEKCCRIYPQDNDSEGFFVSKFRLIKELEER